MKVMVNGIYYLYKYLLMVSRQLSVEQLQTNANNWAQENWVWDNWAQIYIYIKKIYIPICM